MEILGLLSVFRRIRFLSYYYKWHVVRFQNKNGFFADCKTEYSAILVLNFNSHM